MNKLFFGPQTHFQIFRSFFKIQIRRRPLRPATGACFQKTHFSEKARKNNFQKWVLHDLTYMKDTLISCLHTWVFHILLACYFDLNGLVWPEVKSQLKTAKQMYSESFTFSAFWGGDSGQFPSCYRVGRKTAWDPDGNCCHGPN